MGELSQRAGEMSHLSPRSVGSLSPFGFALRLVGMSRVLFAEQKQAKTFVRAERASERADDFLRPTFSLSPQVSLVLCGRVCNANQAAGSHSQTVAAAAAAPSGRLRRLRANTDRQTLARTPKPAPRWRATEAAAVRFLPIPWPRPAPGTESRSRSRSSHPSHARRN